MPGEDLGSWSDGKLIIEEIGVRSGGLSYLGIKWSTSDGGIFQLIFGKFPLKLDVLFAAKEVGQLG
jgi:hypothetical protein